MRKKIAHLLILLADKIYRQEHTERIEFVDNYEARKIGLSRLIPKKEIKDNRTAKKSQERLSMRRADKELIKSEKAYIRKSIIKTIDEAGLIEYSIEKDGGDLLISGEMKVYIKKD